MKIKIAFFLFLGLIGGRTLFGQVIATDIEYHDGTVVLQGYLVYDDAVKGQRPAVMVVPEWLGLNDYSKMRAGQLAQLGYVGFAVDMFGKGVRPKTHEEAAKVSRAYREDHLKMRARAKAAYDFLLKQAMVDPKHVAVIGYCFGGTTALEMARAGLPLAGVASFHGSLGTSIVSRPGDIHTPIRVFHGDEDPFTDPELEGFRKEMREAAVEDWQVVILSGAVHRFTVLSAGNDKSTGAAYNKRADRESWRALVSFLHQVFE